MSNLDLLLKNNIIDFEKILIDKYSSLSLDETDAIVLIKIYEYMKTNSSLNSDAIASKMHINSNEVTRHIISLSERGYMSIELDSEGKEVVKLDGILKALEGVLQGDENKLTEDENKIIINFLNDYVTNSFNKILSSIDLELITHWVMIDKFSYEDICKAVDDCSIKRRYALKYVDAILNTATNSPKPNIDPNLKEKFDNVFNKIK